MGPGGVVVQEAGVWREASRGRDAGSRLRPARGLPLISITMNAQHLSLSMRPQISSLLCDTSSCVILLPSLKAACEKGHIDTPGESRRALPRDAN